MLVLLRTAMYQSCMYFWTLQKNSCWLSQLFSIVKWNKWMNEWMNAGSPPLSPSFLTQAGTPCFVINFISALPGLFLSSSISFLFSPSLSFSLCHFFCLILLSILFSPASSSGPHCIKLNSAINDITMVTLLNSKSNSRFPWKFQLMEKLPLR